MKHNTNRNRIIACVIVLSLLIAPAWGAKRQVRKSARVETIRNITYATVDKTQLLLDLYIPQGATEALPLIVWIHGGGWRQGSKEQCPAVQFTVNGYAAASISYRLTDKATFPAQIYDCKAAIRFLRANAGKYGIDPDRIGVWGASAGGHLAALLGTSGNVLELEGNVGKYIGFSSEVQAVCDWFGPTDFMSIEEASTAQMKQTLDPLVTALLGGKPFDKREAALMASPTTHIWRGKEIPPFLIMHGTKDNIVPLQQSRLLFKQLRKAKVSAKLKIIKGAGHGSGFDKPLVNGMMLRFFDIKLKKEKPQKNKKKDNEISAENNPPSKSFQKLAKASFFSMGGVGFAGVISKEQLALEELLKTDDAESQLKELLQKAKMEGKVYALLGLYIKNKQLYDEKVQPFRKMDVKITVQQGCIVSEAELTKVIVDIEKGSYSIYFKSNGSDEKS